MKDKLKTILLVDDDVPTNHLHKLVIRKLDCAENIVMARTGAEAIDVLTKPDENGNYLVPELIFLDINMPVMNGWEFLEAYKKLELDQQGKFVVVMLTTSLNPDDQSRANELPQVQDFVSKPLTTDILRKILTGYFPDRM